MVSRKIIHRDSNNGDTLICVKALEISAPLCPELDQIQP